MLTATLAGVCHFAKYKRSTGSQGSDRTTRRMFQVAELSFKSTALAALAGVCHYAQYKCITGGADRTNWDSSFLGDCYY